MAEKVDSLVRSQTIVRLAAWAKQAFARPSSRVAVLPIIAAAVVLRDPTLLESPRFWAEEGTNYFASALRGPWFEALLRFRTTAQAGYLNPVPHLSTFIAARFAPLEWGPTITTAVWCALFLTVELVVLFGRASLLSGPWRRAFALAVPLVVTNNGENWVNTLGGHYLCDFAILLLVLEAPRVSGPRRKLGVFAVGFLALASQTSWLMVPAVAILFLRERATYRSYLFSLGGAGVLHLIAGLLIHEPGARPTNDLVAVPHLLLLKLIIWPFAGWSAADAYGDLVRGLSPSSFQLSALIVMVHLLVLVAVLAYVLRKDRMTIAMASAYLTVTAAYVFLGLGVGMGYLSTYNAGRYAWLPNAIGLLLLGHQIDFQRLRAADKKQLCFGLALAMAVLVGIVDYRHPKAPHGPSWRREVSHFRYEPGYDQLRIAPAGWVVDVPPALRRLR